jgi:hypothetical protein
MQRMLLAALLVLVAVPATAQTLKLSFANGRVTLEAQQVPVRAILNEWARLGGTKVTGAEKISGSPLTLQLVDLPEAQALEIILRNVAGYMAAPRRLADGASTYDRILVMATTTAPASTAPANRNPAGGPNAAMQGTQRFIPRPDPEEIPTVDESDTGVNQPVFSFPQAPGGNPFLPNGGQANPFQPVGQPSPFGTPIPPGGVPPGMNQGQPAVTVNPTPPAVAMPGQATPGFGIFGSPQPGAIQPIQQPGQPVRPPGAQ